MYKNRKGFALIELLIVVLILAALATVMLPWMSQNAQNAKYNACFTNIDVMNSAIEMYKADKSTPPAELKNVTGNLEYFPDGPPICPVINTAYPNALVDERVDCITHFATH